MFLTSNCSLETYENNEYLLNLKINILYRKRNEYMTNIYTHIFENNINIYKYIKYGEFIQNEIKKTYKEIKKNIMNIIIEYRELKNKTNNKIEKEILLSLFREYIDKLTLMNELIKYENNLIFDFNYFKLWKIKLSPIKKINN